MKPVHALVQSKVCFVQFRHRTAESRSSEMRRNSTFIVEDGYGTCTSSTFATIVVSVRTLHAQQGRTEPMQTRKKREKGLLCRVLP